MRHSLLTVEEAAQHMRDGAVVAYPTEAIYGLGCDPANEQAVRRILALKHRSEALGLILIGSEAAHLEAWAGAIPDQRMDAVQASWPGPVTWLFPRAASVPAFIAGAHDTVALRLSAHPVCRALCEAFGGAVVSTSANPHSAPPARMPSEVEDYFGPFIAGIVAGALGGREACSEIRDALTGQVLRPG